MSDLITPGGNPTCEHCGEVMGLGVTHVCPSKQAHEETPDEGHTFRFTITHRGSSKVTGEEHHTDAPQFWDDLAATVSVRAWNLRDAITKMSHLPVHVLMGYDNNTEDAKHQSEDRIDRVTEALGEHEPWAGGWHCSCQPLKEDGSADLLPVGYDRHLAEVAIAAMNATE